MSGNHNQRVRNVRTRHGEFCEYLHPQRQQPLASKSNMENHKSPVESSLEQITGRPQLGADVEGLGTTFQQRYQLNHQYYEPGGPVIVLLAGEGDATYLLDNLDHGQ